MSIDEKILEIRQLKDVDSVRPVSAFDTYKTLIVDFDKTVDTSNINHATNRVKQIFDIGSSLEKSYSIEKDRWFLKINYENADTKKNNKLFNIATVFIIIALAVYVYLF